MSQQLRKRQSPAAHAALRPDLLAPVRRGVKQVLTTPSYASAHYTSTYDPELACKALEPYADATIGFVGDYHPSKPVPWVESLVVSNFWTDMFGEVLGGKSPDDAVKSAHERAVRVAKEFGFKGE